MASRIEWTCNSRGMPSFKHIDLRAIETAKSLAKNHRIVKGKLSVGTFMIRPLMPDGIEWLKGLFILMEGEEFLIDITYDADFSDKEVVDGTPIENLNLSSRATNCLMRAEYTTVEKVMSETDNLRNIRNLESGVFAEIMLALEQYRESVQKEEGFEIEIEVKEQK